MRLDLINALKRKHDANNIEELLLIAEEAATELETLEGSSERSRNCLRKSRVY